MKAPRFQAIVAAALLPLAAAWALTAGAASVVPLDLDRITAEARQVVHVRCTGNDVLRDAAVGVVTVTSFVVLDRAKGDAGPTFTVRQPGGTLDGLAVDYRVPKFAVGGEYVLFMPPPSRWGFASPVGLAQGSFAVVAGAAGREVGNGRDIAALLSNADRAAAGPRLAARLAQPPPERTRMDLADFMKLVRDKAARR